MSIGRGLTALSRKRAQAATVLMQRRMQRNATTGRRELHLSRFSAVRGRDFGR
jgi:hypothetical protein